MFRLVQGGPAERRNLILTGAYKFIPATMYIEILNEVKRRLMDFLGSVEGSEGTLEESNSRETPEDPVASPGVATGSVSYHIYGDHNVYGDRNVVATGEQVSQQVSIVRKNDADSLLAYLREQGVEEEDLQELRDAVDSEPEAPGGSNGPRVRKWLDDMMDKASAGALKVGFVAARKMLPEALKGFYGG